MLLFSIKGRGEGSQIGYYLDEVKYTFKFRIVDELGVEISPSEALELMGMNRYARSRIKEDQLIRILFHILEGNHGCIHNIVAQCR